MKLALIQSNVVWEDSARTIEGLKLLVDYALEAGARCILFPEMFTTGFCFPQGERASFEHEQGVSYLTALAARNGIYCGGTLPYRPPGDDRAFNTLVLAGPQGIVGRYSKMHLFRPAEEHRLALAGSEPLTVEIDELRVSFAICYDLRFPELFSRLAAQTDLFVVPANWLAGRAQHWDVLLAARAIENQAYVAGINRVGEDPSGKFLGGSQVISPRGEVIAKAPEHKTVLVVDVLRSEVESWREEFPVLEDRRPEIYATLGAH